MTTNRAEAKRVARLKASTYGEMLADLPVTDQRRVLNLISENRGRDARSMIENRHAVWSRPDNQRRRASRAADKYVLLPDRSGNNRPPDAGHHFWRRYRDIMGVN